MIGIDFEFLRNYYFSENDADIPSSSSFNVDPRKSKSEQKRTKKDKRIPFKEITKNTTRNSSKLSPCETDSSSSDKEATTGNE